MRFRKTHFFPKRIFIRYIFFVKVRFGKKRGLFSNPPITRYDFWARHLPLKLRQNGSILNPTSYWKCSCLDVCACCEKHAHRIEIHRFWGCKNGPQSSHISATNAIENEPFFIFFKQIYRKNRNRRVFCEKSAHRIEIHRFSGCKNGPQSSHISATNATQNEPFLYFPKKKHKNSNL